MLVDIVTFGPEQTEITGVYPDWIAFHPQLNQPTFIRLNPSETWMRVPCETNSLGPGMSARFHRFDAPPLNSIEPPTSNG